MTTLTLRAAIAAAIAAGVVVGASPAQAYPFPETQYCAAADITVRGVYFDFRYRFSVGSRRYLSYDVMNARTGYSLGSSSCRVLPDGR